MNNLSVNNFDGNRYLSILVSKFDGIGQKVHEYLHVATLVSIHRTYELKIRLAINIGLHLNVCVFRHVNHHGKSLVNNLSQIKIFARQLERIILKLCEVQEIVYEIFSHLLGEYLFL